MFIVYVKLQVVFIILCVVPYTCMTLSYFHYFHAQHNYYHSRQTYCPYHNVSHTWGLQCLNTCVHIVCELSHSWWSTIWPTSPLSVEVVRHLVFMVELSATPWRRGETDSMRGTHNLWVMLTSKQNTCSPLLPAFKTRLYLMYAFFRKWLQAPLPKTFSFSVC